MSCGVLKLYFILTTVRFRYNTVLFYHDIICGTQIIVIESESDFRTRINNPISRPHGRAMGCLLWDLGGNLRRFNGTALYISQDYFTSAMRSECQGCNPELCVFLWIAWSSQTCSWDTHNKTKHNQTVRIGCTAFTVQWNIYAVLCFNAHFVLVLLCHNLSKFTPDEDNNCNITYSQFYGYKWPDDTSTANTNTQNIHTNYREYSDLGMTMVRITYVKITSWYWRNDAVMPVSVENIG